MPGPRTTLDLDDVAHGPARRCDRNLARIDPSLGSVSARAHAIVLTLLAACFSEADGTAEADADADGSADSGTTGGPTTAQPTTSTDGGDSSSAADTTGANDSGGSSSTTTGSSESSGVGSSDDGGSTGGGGACAAMGDVACGDGVSVPGELCWGATQADNAGIDPLGRAVVADFDGDGHDDVAAIDGSDGIRVYLGSSSGLGPPTSLAGTETPWSIAVGDLDDDGDLDLAVGALDPQVTIYLGSGDGAFAPIGPPLDVGEGAEIVRIADIDGDGTAELLVAGEFDDATTGPWVTVFDGGDGDWTSGTDDFQLPGTASIRDMRPFLDPAFAAPGLVVFLTDGQLVFAPPADGFSPEFSPVTALTPGEWRITVGDLDGDDDPDVAMAGLGRVMLMNYDGATLGDSTTIGVASNHDMDVAIGDLDRDGDADLVVADDSFHRVQIYPQRGGAYGAPTPVVLAEQPRGVVLGHVTGDCQLDVVTFGDSVVELVPPDP